MVRVAGWQKVLWNSGKDKVHRPNSYSFSKDTFERICTSIENWYHQLLKSSLIVKNAQSEVNHWPDWRRVRSEPLYHTYDIWWALCGTFIRIPVSKIITIMVLNPGPPRSQRVAWSLPVCVVFWRTLPSAFDIVRICCYPCLFSAKTACNGALVLFPAPSPQPTPPITTIRSTPQIYTRLQFQSSVDCTQRLGKKKGSHWT